MICYGFISISVSPELTLRQLSLGTLASAQPLKWIFFPLLWPLFLNHLPAISSVFSITQRCRHMYAKSLLVYLRLYQHRETRGSGTVVSALLPRAHKMVFAILPALSYKSVEDWKMTIPEFQKLGLYEELWSCSRMRGVAITKGDNKLKSDLILSIYKIKQKREKIQRKKSLFLKCRFF